MIIRKVSDTFAALTAEMDKVIEGYKDIKLFSIASMYADKHELLVGLPGTAKSLFVEAFQSAIADSRGVRLQLTPDVKPMDIVGVKVFNPATGKFDFEPGPLYDKNFVLFDELNRAPGKTLSAILSAMEERRIFISGQEFELPDPFFCMATQNPREQEGVYPLPEAAVDRFGGNCTVPYADEQSEENILGNEALDSRDAKKFIKAVVSTKEIVEIREGIKKEVFVSPAARSYIVRLIRATRPGLDRHTAVLKLEPKFDKLIDVGSSVRGQLSLRNLSRVFAALNGRSFVLPEDIHEVLLPVLRHRVDLTFEATADGKTSDEAIEIIKTHVPFDKNKDAYTPRAA